MGRSPSEDLREELMTRGLKSGGSKRVGNCLSPSASYALPHGLCLMASAWDALLGMLSLGCSLCYLLWPSAMRCLRCSVGMRPRVWCEKLKQRTGAQREQAQRPLSFVARLSCEVGWSRSEGYSAACV